MSKSLFDYMREIDDIVAKATDDDGIIDFDAIKEDLDALEVGAREKVDNCIAFYKSRKAMADALKNEKKAIERRQKTAQNEADRMKEYLFFCLNGEKYERTAGKISYRKSESVEVTDLGKIPDEFLKWKADADKTAIKEELKQGVIVEGAHLVEKLSTIIK